MPENFHPKLAEWRDIDARERNLAILPGTPVLARPDGDIDYRLVDYFTKSLVFRNLAPLSKRTYAIEMRMWFDFLWRTRSIDWDEATEDDVMAYQFWRMSSPENEGRVSGATWAKAVAAMDKFYAWAAGPPRHYVEFSPVPVGAGGRAKPGVRPKNARQSRDRWISPRTYVMWRDVGLRGYDAVVDDATGEVKAGTVSVSERGRNDVRNAAFTDLMFSAALRRGELGLLLVEELPESWADEVFLPPTVTKGGVERAWTVVDPNALKRVDTYLARTRLAAIRRAQAQGRYESMSHAIIAEEVVTNSAHGVAVRLGTNETIPVSELTPGQRQVLLRRTNQGLEPMMLWVSEDGLPMSPASWTDVFKKANARVSLEYQRLGRRGAPPRLTPHSLRFTCALFVLLAYARAIDERLGLDAAEPWVDARYAEAFGFVQSLLGHARIETTRNVYLKPLKDLRSTSLLRESADVSAVMTLLAGRSSLIYDPTENP